MPSGTETDFHSSDAESFNIIIIIIIIIIIPADRNVVQKESEKKLKYKSLCIEIQRMWNLKCTIIPVITGATGIVTRSLKKNWKLYQENIRQIHYKRQLHLEHQT